MNDYKYIWAYLIPVSGFAAVAYAGYWSYLTVFIAFGFIPLFEAILPQNPSNLDEETEQKKNANRFFKYLLYINLPLVFGLIAFFFYKLQNVALANFEITGLCLSTGIVLGAAGINVAHELGHKKSKTDQFFSKLLLLPTLYMHFFIEHNRGHHRSVGTPEDSATAKKNENLYFFWIRSVVGGYINAWKLEKIKLSKKGKSAFSLQNEMLVFQITQIAYLIIIGFVFSLQIMLFGVAIAIVGFLLLESINYVEHYGLFRRKLDNGKYEKVSLRHSWNSDHELGRIMLYELVRHSDHHYKASRNYQVLRHFDESPQLPYGYPSSMILAMLPPLWFRIMNPLVDQWEKKSLELAQ